MRKYVHHPVFPVVVTLCLLALPLSVSAQVSDDFSGVELDPATWSFIDPAGDCSYSLQNGLFTLHIPADSGHDPRGDNNRAVRLMQNVADADFEVEAKFESIPTQIYQVQGLLVETDPTHYLRLEYHRAGPDLKVSCVTVTGGITKIQGEANILADGALWLRLSRSGDTWRGFHSQDGQAWTEQFV